ncbi:benzoate/H(+) symporter BenE family transporter [Acinetobacter larvae]|uniref:Benzoate transporter n=1 Tax=Acinetobacter larvae TaxID=1789224 RepID=A0A1B2LYH5_9GAMM|nr:benzoate/H(+) symporter BenE family transporter [Acinetobacter larvae]AOA57997.1 hypothetical protein BFG52_06290 [Acinetobacter larvae]
MSKLIRDFSVTAAFAGFLTFLIGISVSSVLVIQAARGLGADVAEISSWFWALGIGIGSAGLLLSWRFKYPVATSWSTAGLALIIAVAEGYQLAEAIAAFLICGALTAVLGFLGVFQRLLTSIPQALTSAMLAGVLLKFGIGLFADLQNHWSFILSLLAIYIVAKRFSPRYSLVITVIAGVMLSCFMLNFSLSALDWHPTTPVWVQPEFTWAALLGLALPLFVINMASQYLPGIAMIQNYGYKPHVNGLIGWTGLIQTLLAPFGAFSVNIAAISAAISLDEQVHPESSKRYIAGMVCGLCYIIMGLFAATLTQLLLAFPSLFIATLAGIALLATISHNIVLAFQDVQHRDAALMTFLFSASGVQFFGIGSAFWGLLFGLSVYWIFKLKFK